jgi:hypothetical protein
MCRPTAGNPPCAGPRPQSHACLAEVILSLQPVPPRQRRPTRLAASPQDATRQPARWPAGRSRHAARAAPMRNGCPYGRAPKVMPECCSCAESADPPVCRRARRQPNRGSRRRHDRRRSHRSCQANAASARSKPSTVDQLAGQGRTVLVKPGRPRHNQLAAAYPLRVAL